MDPGNIWFKGVNGSSSKLTFDTYLLASVMFSQAIESESINSSILCFEDTELEGEPLRFDTGEDTDLSGCDRDDDDDDDDVEEDRGA
jgi:hypothetical protein